MFGQDVPPAPSAGLITEKDGKILALKLSYKDGYNLPGGGMEQGETAEECVVREVKEETGLNAKNLKYFGSYKYTKNFPGIAFIFTGDVSGKLVSTKEGVPEWIVKDKIIPLIVEEDNVAALKDYLKKG